MIAPRRRIEVSGDHIRNAVPADSARCMGPDAIWAAIPTARNVSVDIRSCRWTDSETGIRWVYLTPNSLAGPLQEWDEGVIPQPFVFVLSTGNGQEGGRSGLPRRRLVPAKAPDRRERPSTPARLQAVTQVVRDHIAEHGEIPSARAVARKLGKTDDKQTRQDWDTLTAAGTLPSRVRDRPFEVEGAIPVRESLLGTDRVFGARVLSRRHAQLMRAAAERKLVEE